MYVCPHWFREYLVSWRAVLLWTILVDGCLCGLAPEKICYDRFELNAFEQHVGSSGCPSMCRYENLCAPSNSKQCVAELDCHYLQKAGIGVVSNGTAQCRTCDIKGCKRCKSAELCETCAAGYDLLDGGTTCSRQASYAGYVIFAGSIVLGAWFWIDAFRAHFRTDATNTEALELGLQHRFRMRIRQDTSGHPVYPLVSTNMHTSSIIGIDVALFMNWFLLVGSVAIWLTLLSLIFAPRSDMFDISRLCLVLHNVPIRDNVTGEVATMEAFKAPEVPHTTLWSGLSYLGVLILTITFLILQEKNYNNLLQQDEKSPMLHKFAVEAHGFPADATDHAEIKAYISSILDYLLGVRTVRAVIDISICYDFYEHRAVIESLGDVHLHMVQDHATSQGETRKRNRPSLTQREHAILRMASGWGADFEARMSEKPEIRDYAGPFWIQILGFFMLGTCLDFTWFGKRLQVPGYSAAEKAPGSEEAVDLLLKLENSGTVVVVLHTESLKHVLLKSGLLPQLFRGKHTIIVSNLVEEPESMQWVNYQRDFDSRKKIFFSILFMAVSLTVWIFLYLPSVMYAQSALTDESSTAFFANTSMGMIIALGNAMISAVVTGLSEYIGFRHQSRARLMQLLVITPCVILNVICDFGVTFWAAHQKYSEEMPTNEQFRLTYGLHYLQNEIFDLLVPGYVIVPYLAEPFFTVMLKLWVGVWRIKSDKRISCDEAERLLVAGEVDIVNPPLSDMIVVTSTFCVTFISPGSKHLQLWAALVLFSVLTYGINRIRILRWQSKTFYSTDVLHRTQCYLWSLPVAVLAATFGMNVAGPQTLLQTFFFWFAGFFGQLVLYIAFVTFVLPAFRRPPKLQPKTYDEASENVKATYMNTNPVEVLRSRLKDFQCERSEGYCPSHIRKLVLYRPGREHLQPNADSHYEGLDKEFSVFGLPMFGQNTTSIPHLPFSLPFSPLGRKAAKAGQTDASKNMDLLEEEALPTKMSSEPVLPTMEVSRSSLSSVDAYGATKSQTSKDVAVLRAPSSAPAVTHEVDVPISRPSVAPPAGEGTVANNPSPRATRLSASKRSSKRDSQSYRWPAASNASPMAPQGLAASNPLPAMAHTRHAFGRLSLSAPRGSIDME
eukprot:TRINITY_DN12595_c0_g5_i1.p1 TRINITY_DN12595_c0_g5~~TRINITY_DN12595_c0_g5_i1.p1  ORF type:complete len:1133 (-),score=116.83 TRINITY_DN12595_c0_g5_i1:462-3824(-)